jgi:hypothetical protein
MRMPDQAGHGGDVAPPWSNFGVIPAGKGPLFACFRILL